MKKLGYISVHLCKEQEKIISDELIALGLDPVSEYNFHVTMMYDKRECDEPRCIINPDVIYEGVIVGFKILGDAIVAELHSRGLQTEFKRLVAASYEHSFPNCLLHVSFVYDPKPYDLVILESGMSKWLGQTLRFTNETLTPCK